MNSNVMSDIEIRLECMRCAGGDVEKSRELYKFMTEAPQPPQDGKKSA